MTADFLVLGVLLLAQLAFLAKARRLARESDSDALEGLVKRFEPDIQSRAVRGDGPDWVRYMDEADRVHERRLDAIRGIAHAALVLGIGGTLTVLSFRLLSTTTDSSTALAGLTSAIGPALFASLLGVANNLVITLRLFPISDRQFTASLETYRTALQAHSDVNHPTEKFADAVRDQLGNAFRDAVRTFPEAFARLDDSIAELSKVTEEQSSAAMKAARELRGSAQGLASAAREVAPATRLLLTSTEHLRELPDRLSQTLDASVAQWKKEIRHDQDSFVSGVRQVLDRQQKILEGVRDTFEDWERQRSEVAAIRDEEWLNSMSEVEKAVARISSTVEGLPAQFAQEVQKTADTLGKEFGLEARQHVEDLVRAVRQETETRGEQAREQMRELHTRFLNDTSGVVARTLETVYERVEKSLLASLHDVGEGLREAMETLPENARGFASSLAQADTRLRKSLASLSESAEHLGRVARITEQFEASLIRTLQNSTEQSYRPVLQQFEESVRELRSTATTLERGRGSVRIRVEQPLSLSKWLLQSIRRQLRGGRSRER